MKVVDLHPEELLDKEARGELTESERGRLEAHVERCVTCRFEREVRADFADELEPEAALSSQRLVALIEGLPTPKTDPPAATEVPDGQAPAERTPSTRPARVRRSARIVLLIAAALFIGGAATAGAGAHVWTRIAASFSDAERIETAGGRPLATTSATTKAAQRAEPAAPIALAGTSAEPTTDPMPEPILVAAIPAAVPPVPIAAAPARLVLTNGGNDPPRAPAPIAPLVIPPAAAVPEAQDDSAPALFEAANDARRRGDYARALVLHRRLEIAHPASREAHVSYATVGRLLLDRGDPAGALASFDAYQARGSGPLDEAVMVGRATALDRLGRTADAPRAWSSLLHAFPDTPYGDYARAHAQGAR